MRKNDLEDRTVRRGSISVSLVALLALLVGCTPLADAIRGSGRLVTGEADISGFDQVDVGYAFDVDIRQDETYSVVVRIDDNLADYLVVEKQGSTLGIGLEPGYSYTMHKGEVEITMPILAGLELSGSCDGKITGFASSEHLRVRISGASRLRGDIEAGDANIDVSGASELTLRGSGGNLTLETSGASTVDLSGFPVDNADIDASGASRIDVNSSGTLDANASGASVVRYRGDPGLGRIDTSGSSSVRQR